MLYRDSNFKSLPLNIVGSSVFGKYPKINNQYTYNMYISDNALVPYPGYKIGLSNSKFGFANNGRALYPSTKFDSIIGVFDSRVYLININYDHKNNKIVNNRVVQIGELQTSSGKVWIAENNKPQILLSDNEALYLYDPQLKGFTASLTPGVISNNTLTFIGTRPLIAGEKIEFTNVGGLTGVVTGKIYYVSAFNLSYNQTTGVITFSVSNTPTDAKIGNNVPITGNPTTAAIENNSNSFVTIDTDFRPGYISFHDTYFLCAASSDNFYSPAANNTWRLSDQNNGLLWGNDASSIGLLETKPDNTQAVLRFPSAGNMIMVMGETVSEPWFDTGGQLFPYQRNNQYNIDYGCVSPNSIAHFNNYIVWLAWNEKSGPIIMYSEGNVPKAILSDGIDTKLSEFQNPQNCSAFIYRQDGHTIYHINFYSDNYSLMYDFTTQKFYNSCDQNYNYYHIDSLVFFRNQYFGISPRDGNFYIVDTAIDYYQTVDDDNNVVEFDIPRTRTTMNYRLPSQNYFVINDIGFTIESGTTDYRYYKTEGLDLPYTLTTVSGDTLVTMSGDTLVTTDLEPDSGTDTYQQIIPKVAVSVSYDGGETFGNFWEQDLKPIGQRRNKLQWWQLGVSNDSVFKFLFTNTGRVVVLDGEVNIRQ